MSSDGPPIPAAVVAGEDRVLLAPSTLSLADALILAVAERLGHRVLTRDAYWKWMVDNGHLNVAVTIP